ncbi:MAG: hypothetical protein KDA98_17930 [Acidimicrobiales bacterium]|nr:hypothetical protein [Acidimicrobiales bacterium]
MVAPEPPESPWSPVPLDLVPDPGPTLPPRLRDELRELGTVGRAWAATVVLLCLARALVIWPALSGYGISPWWFLVLDVGTAPAYGVGQAMSVKLLRDETRPVRDALPWIACVLGAFLAPYAYVLHSAGHLPGYVTWGVVAWVLIYGTFVAWRMAREVRMEPLVG